MRCLLAAGLTALVSLAVLAPAAIAHDGGQGLYGETDDKIVTNAGFILIIFFPLFILLMSLAQARLDKRKEARKAAHTAAEASDEPRGGW
jgi:ABC-type nickel/cobalt efflux system permease component RcnA